MSQKMVSVPADVLQALIYNATFMCAGQYNDDEVSGQADELQGYIDAEHGEIVGGSIATTLDFGDNTDNVVSLFARG